MEHRRINEDDNYLHEREDDPIPRWLKWTLSAINRCGFPIMAFIGMWYFAVVSLDRINRSIMMQTSMLQTLISTMNERHEEAQNDRRRIIAEIEDLERRGR